METENLDRSITSDEAESVIKKKLAKMKSPGPGGLIGDFTGPMCARVWLCARTFMYS